MPEGCRGVCVCPCVYVCTHSCVCVCPCAYVCALMSVCLCACVNRRKGRLHLHRQKSNELMPGVLQLRDQL